MRVLSYIAVLFISGGVFLGVGGCKSMTPGDISRVQTTSGEPRVGNVYLLRGFIGIWSYGINTLGQKVEDAGIRASIYQEDQWSKLCDTIIEKYQSSPEHEPLVLIGHSYGADDTLKMAKRFQEHKITVDLIVTLDPVTPPKVPGNVKLCYNIYQPSLLDTLPFFRGVALETEDPEAKNLQNVNIRKERRDLLNSDTDHFNIEKNEKIHAEVVKVVSEFCPPRPQWLAQRQAGRLTSSLPPAYCGGSAAEPRRVGSANPALERVP